MQRWRKMPIPWSLSPSNMLQANIRRHRNHHQWVAARSFFMHFSNEFYYLRRHENAIKVWTKMYSAVWGEGRSQQSGKLNVKCWGKMNIQHWWHFSRSKIKKLFRYKVLHRLELKSRIASFTLQSLTPLNSARNNKSWKLPFHSFCHFKENQMLKRRHRLCGGFCLRFAKLPCKWLATAVNWPDLWICKPLCWIFVAPQRWWQTRLNSSRFRRNPDHVIMWSSSFKTEISLHAARFRVSWFLIISKHTPFSGDSVFSQIVISDREQMTYAAGTAASRFVMDLNRNWILSRGEWDTSLFINCSTFKLHIRAWKRKKLMNPQVGSLLLLLLSISQ